MGSIVSRGRQQTQRKMPTRSQPQSDGVYPGAAESKSPSKAESVKMEPRPLPFTKRVVVNQELTEEMIEGLTRSSSDSQQNKTRKKDALDNWLLRANYRVTAENDALERHRRSMEALEAMQASQRDRVVRPRSEHSRRDSRSKGSQPRQPPKVEVYRGVPASA